MSNVITMVDESLGGVLREYRQVEMWDAEKFRTTKLEATDVVVIDGERYRMVDRKAEVGEKVIYLGEGRIANVISDDADWRGGSHETYYSTANDSDYRSARVLEPLPSEECTGEPVTVSAHDVLAHPDRVIDMFAALAQRSAELERQVTTLEAKLDDLAGTNERALKRVAGRVEENGKNVETLAQDLEAVKAIMLSNEEDIRTLDERTQSPTSASENVTLPKWLVEKLVGGARI